MASKRLQSFAKDIQLATAAIAPAAIQAALADFARTELARSIASGEASPDYIRYVNGVQGAVEADVVPPGPILYVFSWWNDIIPFALQYLIERSPAASGRYKSSWFVMVDGTIVSDFASIPIEAVVTIANDQPYSRKIDVGHMKMSVPPGVVEDARKRVQYYFGNLVTARRTLVDLPNAYILKGHFRRGYRKFARTKLRKDTQAGAVMTYPALHLSIKA